MYILSFNSYLKVKRMTLVGRFWELNQHILFQVLFSMWQHQELREVYKKSGWKESDFVTKTVAARNARPNSPTHLNSTLNRPMASQG